MNVIVTGSLAYDYIMDFPGRFADRIMPDKIHKLSLGFLVDKLEKQFGGTAGNIGYTLKLLGIEPLILSAAGNDFSSYREFFKKNKITTAYISQHDDLITGSYFVVTDKEDNQIGSFYIGAMKYNQKLSIKHIKEKISLVVISAHIPRAMLQNILECKEKNLPYMFDPAFQIDHFSQEELRSGIASAKVFIGNDYEVSLVEKKLAVSHGELVKLVPIVITTLGSKGSVIESSSPSFWGAKRLQNPDSGQDGYQTVTRQARMTKVKDSSRIHIKPAKPKNTSDPTGAGDAYRAGFLAGFLCGFDLKVCGQMGSVAAVYTVEKYGTQTHTFTKKEFCQRYRENYGTSIVL